MGGWLNLENLMDICGNFIGVIELTKIFRFEAAHWLPQFPEGHKCRRLHGHSFVIEVVLRGEPDETGILIDFGEVKKIVKPIIDSLDHQCLNHLGEEWNDELLLKPSSENLAKWIYQKVKPLLPMLYAVTVHETCTSKCTYWGS